MENFVEICNVKCSYYTMTQKKMLLSIQKDSINKNIKTRIKIAFKLQYIDNECITKFEKFKILDELFK